MNSLCSIVHPICCCFFHPPDWFKLQWPGCQGTNHGPPSDGHEATVSTGATATNGVEPMVFNRCIPIQMLRRYWSHCRKPFIISHCHCQCRYLDPLGRFEKNVWSKLRWIQSTGIKGVKDVFFEDAAPIKTHECCTSSRTHGHGTVAKLSQLLHHVYSLQIHGYGFDCVCLKMVHTPTWQFVYWKIGDYPLSAVFFGGGTCFSNKPICCHQKTEVSWVLYQSPENPSGMYGLKYVWDPIRSADFIGFYSYTICLR